MMEDLEEVKTIKYKDVCCESYKTPKGRCYTCPELEDELESGSELEEVGMQKDPDEETW